MTSPGPAGSGQHALTLAAAPAPESPTVDDFSAHGQQEGLSCPHSSLVPTALQC